MTVLMAVVAGLLAVPGVASAHGAAPGSLAGPGIAAEPSAAEPAAVEPPGAVRWSHGGFDDARDAVLAPDGTVLVADAGAHRLRRLDPGTGQITSVAGTGTAGSGGDGLDATFAQLDTPVGVALLPDGDVVVSEQGGHKLRRIDAGTNVIETLAGTGIEGFSGDGGPALDARLDTPAGLALAPDGALLVAERGSRRIRRVDLTTLTISTVAGDGTIPAADAPDPTGPPNEVALGAVADLDVMGDVLVVAIPGPHPRVRTVDAEGVRTIAGVGSTLRRGPFGFPALEASLGAVDTVVVDGDGVLVPGGRVDLDDGLLTAGMSRPVSRTPDGDVLVAAGGSVELRAGDFPGQPAFAEAPERLDLDPGGASGPHPVTVSLNGVPEEVLEVSAVPRDHGVLPPDRVVLTGTGPQRSLTVDATGLAPGATTVQLRARHGAFEPSEPAAPLEARLDVVVVIGGADPLWLPGGRALVRWLDGEQPSAPVPTPAGDVVFLQGTTLRELDPVSGLLSTLVELPEARSQPGAALDGDVLVGATDGYRRWDRTTGTLTEQYLGGVVTSLAVASDGDVYAATTGVGVVRVDATTGDLEVVPGAPAPGAVDAQERLIAGGTAFDPDTGETTKLAGNGEVLGVQYDGPDVELEDGPALEVPTSPGAVTRGADGSLLWTDGDRYFDARGEAYRRRFVRRFDPATQNLTTVWGGPDLFFHFHRPSGLRSGEQGTSLGGAPSGATITVAGALVVTGVDGADDGGPFVAVVRSASTPLPTPPGPPLDVTASAGALAGEVVVTWSPPVDDGGAPVTGYRVVAEPGGGSCTTDGATSCAVTGLDDGRRYSFTVVATTIAGEGSPSAPTDGVAPTACDGSDEEGPFADVPRTSPFCSSIEWLVVSEVTTGYDDGTFRPTEPVTRQATAAFLHRLAGSPTPVGDGASFTDVPADHPFHAAITWLAEQGITEGYDDGRFGPDEPVSRQAMAAFLARWQGPDPLPEPGAAPFTDVPAGHAFAAAIAWLVAEGIAGGYDDGTYRPSAPVSRQAMAAFLDRATA